MVGKKSAKHNTDKPQARSEQGKLWSLFGAVKSRSTGKYFYLRLDSSHGHGLFRPHSIGDKSLKLATVAYFAALTFLLLTRDPFGTIGIHLGVRGILRSLLPYAHFLSFLLLAVLVLSGSWPLRRWTVLAILLGYATATECLQWFVRGRTPEFFDLVQDFLGIAVGAAICWACLRARVMFVQYASS